MIKTLTYKNQNGPQSSEVNSKNLQADPRQAKSQEIIVKQEEDATPINLNNPEKTDNFQRKRSPANSDDDISGFTISTMDPLEANVQSGNCQSDQNLMTCMAGQSGQQINEKLIMEMLKLKAMQSQQEKINESQRLNFLQNSNENYWQIQQRLMMENAIQRIQCEQQQKLYQDYQKKMNLQMIEKIQSLKNQELHIQEQFIENIKQLHLKEQQDKLEKQSLQIQNFINFVRQSEMQNQYENERQQQQQQQQQQQKQEVMQIKVKQEEKPEELEQKKKIIKMKNMSKNKRLKERSIKQAIEFLNKIEETRQESKLTIIKTCENQKSPEKHTMIITDCCKDMNWKKK